MSVEGMARSLYRNMATFGDRYRRERLRIPIGEGRSSQPAVYFLIPDHPEPSGGIRVIYRHVDILNAAGIDAFVLHWRPGFRCSWFDNATKVTDCVHAKIRQGDLLVVAEIDVDLLSNLPKPLAYVIFNQNSHLTWRHAPERIACCYRPGSGLIRTVTVSRHNQRMLEMAFGEGLVERIHLSIDGALFHPGGRPRTRSIAYMPRRGHESARQVIEILRARGSLRDWELLPLDGLSHAEVAAYLRTTRIFLAFTQHEGFGLPAAEAMACGNYVVGNHGFGGSEFFRPEFSATVESGDVVGFVEAVEAAIASERADPDWCRDRGLVASHFIRSEYSVEREREEVVRLYTGILQRLQPASDDKPARNSGTSASAGRTGIEQG